MPAKTVAAVFEGESAVVNRAALGPSPNIGSTQLRQFNGHAGMSSHEQSGSPVMCHLGRRRPS